MVSEAVTGRISALAEYMRVAGAPVGVGEVVAGLLVSAAFLVPGVLLHRFLRHRGR